MCLAIPGKIVRIDGRQAQVEYPGETRKVLLTDDVKVDISDYVMVQMGIVVKRISQADYKLLTKAPIL